jgi:two-component system, NtrC family, nitrogen regulation response regulator NtrX
VVPIAVPSLDDRREDIPLIARHFIDHLNRAQGLPARALSEETDAVMQTMDWPGNIRQLRNAIEGALILGDAGRPIEPHDLPGHAPTDADDSRITLTGGLATLPLREARELFEREYLLTQINRFGGNISRTAAFVGMERSALHRKLKSLGVVTTSKSGARMAHFEEEEEEV